MSSLVKKTIKKKKFYQEVSNRLKQAKKLLWTKKKQYNEEKTKNVNNLITELIKNEKENDSINPIFSEIADVLKKQTDSEITEIPDYFLCKINYVKKHNYIKNSHKK